MTFTSAQTALHYSTTLILSKERERERDSINEQTTGGGAFLILSPQIAKLPSGKSSWRSGGSASCFISHPREEAMKDAHSRQVRLHHYHHHHHHLTPRLLHTHTNAHTLSLTHTHTNVLSLSHTHTHIHTHTHAAKRP